MSRIKDIMESGQNLKKMLLHTKMKYPQNHKSNVIEEAEITRLNSVYFAQTL